MKRRKKIKKKIQLVRKTRETLRCRVFMSITILRGPWSIKEIKIDNFLALMM
jgi:hypothetical protein